MNHGWRDYGPRAGIWRLVDLLESLDMPASVMLNSAACQRYPQIIRAGRDRGWAWLAHARDNSTLQTGIEPEQERVYLTGVLDTIECAAGQRPRGWLGPALSETLRTPWLVRELGVSYRLDRVSDDQPYPLSIEGLISVPHSAELNDIPLFTARNLVNQPLATATWSSCWSGSRPPRERG